MAGRARRSLIQRFVGRRLTGAVKPSVSSKKAHCPSSLTSMRQPSSVLPPTEWTNHACAGLGVGEILRRDHPPVGVDHAELSHGT
ncbi:hypothetical protein I548_5001 [Mycobacterium intracellulare]|nr:hypothetical protein I548_5001 [Mycobacterium intracellulare]